MEPRDLRLSFRHDRPLHHPGTSSVVRFKILNRIAFQNANVMRLKIHFYSYFKDLTGCAETTEELAGGNNIADLLKRLIEKFPKLATMQKSTLIAVGVEYQNK